MLKIIMCLIILNTCILIPTASLMVREIIYNRELILKEIQKHSVHPQYGNIENVNYCNPWDAC